MMMWKRLALIAALAATGCEDQGGVRVYSAPREKPVEVAAHAHGGPAAVEAPPAPRPGDEVAAWTLPAGWTVDPAPRSMRYATLRAGELEVAITRFPGDVGGLEANVNRWRQQLGLEAVAGAGLEATLERLGAAVLVDLRSPTGEARMLAALLPRPAETWFVKASGPAGLVGQEEARIRELVASIRFEVVGG